MKKLLFTITLLAGFVISFNACNDDDEDIKITVNDLPDNAKSFL